MLETSWVVESSIGVVRSTLGLSANSTPSAVVHQDWCGACFYIVGVEAVDGEVVGDLGVVVTADVEVVGGVAG
jgi:hypothetical protein